MASGYSQGYHMDPSSSSSTSQPRPPVNQPFEEEEEEPFDPLSIDPAYRLRTVKTAHSVLAESIRSEAFADERKRRRRRVFSGIKRKVSTYHVGSGRKRSGADLPPIPSESSARERSSTVTTSTRERSSTITNAPSDFGAVSIAPGPSDSGEPLPTKPRKPFLQRVGDFIQGGGKERILTKRTVWVNLPLPSTALNPKGEPHARYERNKVRTSKYTIITYLPKNLFEQFRRIANVYFLTLVILQLFPVFGAPNAQIGMLPLVFILVVTAIKDGFEDWRRARLDNEVNNSATTKLGGWRNVNQPRDPRSFFERMLGLGPAPGKTTKGVRKLREAEANAGKQIVMDQAKAFEEQEEVQDVVVVDKETIPLDTMPSIAVSAATPEPPDYDFAANRFMRPQSMQSAPSMMSRRSVGVMDWSDPATGSAQWERTLWKKLEVGDLVLLRDNEQVPADIIVLATSHAEDLCFVETKNLDGETNLKIRKALKATARIQSEEDLEHAKFIIESEAPHANLYNYNGVLRYTPAGEGKGNSVKSEAITINEMLLRGCSLRNTKWVIGLVMFTGADTKIMLNGGDTPSKRSKIEKETNFNVAMNFAVLLALCLVTALISGYFGSIDNTSATWYEIGAKDSNSIYVEAVIIFFSCLIVFQNIVPISLYITIEVVKTIQAYFIWQDVDMYYEAYDTPCVPKTWNISDDLGQIEYVFSDKTGTLTQNVMEFKKCSVRGVTFGEGMTEAMMGAAKRQGAEGDLTSMMEDQEPKLAAAKAQMVKTMKATISNRYLREDKLTLVAPDLAAHLANASDPLRPHLINFFRALAICHTVLSDVPDTSKPTVLDYKAESPDEAALVGAARDIGFPFINRNANRIDIEVLGQAEKWTPLRVLEFNSTRKRMSVVARDPQGRVVLFTKGADSVIFQRLAPDHDERLKEATLRDLETFANGGLRTLLVAQRYLDEREFASWADAYDTACAAVSDREAEIDKACELIEHDLTILGATALEDKLQEGVPDAIATLHRAGIKLWILTGDKVQTAIEIGYSCNLLTNDMEVMIISADSDAGARAQIEAGLNKIASMLGPLSANPVNKGKRVKTAHLDNFAIVIDGDSLRFALHESLKGLFLELCTQCAAVICCRVSPSQKALTVRLVKEGCKAMTLSIGDGANDVAMIQEANVGVGLFGLEGSQAAMSADYAFGQFRFLTRLLLVHGRWSYVRIADMHANFFYKNIIWTLALFWYMIYCSFDATYVFDFTILLLYNTVFTSLPVGIMGAFDQDTNAVASLAFPQLYKRGIASLDYTRTRFWAYMLDGLYQSAVIFFIPYLALNFGSTGSSTARDTNSLPALGATVAAAGVLAANLYIGINTRYWTIIMFVIYIASTLLFYVFFPIYSLITTPPFAGVAVILYSTFDFWATVVLAVFCAVMPRFLLRAFRQSYMPMDKDIVREAWVAGDLKRQLGIRRRRDKSDPEASMASAINRNFNSSPEYELANTASPRREYPRSPLLSEAGTPRGPFSYPPSPANPNTMPLSPTLSSRPSVPPPLLIRHESDRSENSTPVPAATRVLETPMSNFSYTSPSAIDTFNMTSAEIKRMSRNSIEIKRASMTSPPSSSSKRNSLTSPNRPSPVRRLSLPLGSMQAVQLSPVRQSFDQLPHEEDEDVFAPGQSSRIVPTRSRSAHDVNVGPAMSDSREWEEMVDERRRSKRGSMLGQSSPPSGYGQAF